MTETLELEAPFSGELYHEYTFRVRARDLVGHTSDWITSTVAIVNQTKYYFLDGRRVAMRKGDQVFYLYGDHLGSTTLATNESGEVVYKGHYLPYGGERSSEGVSPTNFGFTDQRNEVGLGLIDYNARYYDSFLGRFISPDPIVPEPTSSSGLNRYRYARNNPVKYNDPSGHCVFVVDTAACVIGAAYAFGIVGAALTIKYTGVLDPAAEQAGAGIKEALHGIPFNEGHVEPLPGYGPGELTLLDPGGYHPGPTLDTPELPREFPGPSLEIEEQTAIPGFSLDAKIQDNNLSLDNRNPADIAGNTPYRPIQNSVTKSYVERYAQAMANGTFQWDRMRDHIKILNANNGQFILEGHHRVLAAQLAGVEIPSEAIKFSEIDGDWPIDPGWKNVRW